MQDGFTLISEARNVSGDPEKFRRIDSLFLLQPIAAVDMAQQ
jgi:hypothetical protein